MEEKERRINWMQIVATALITGAVTIVTGFILFRLQTKEPKLVYTATETRPFRGTDRNFAIYNLSISNLGGASIADVVSIVQVPDATLEDLRVVADPSLKYTYDIVSDTLELQIPELNPNETMAVSVLATSQTDLPDTPDVSLRGSGITGVETTSPERKDSRDFLVSIAAAIFGAGGGLTTLQYFRRGLPIGPVSGKHQDDQNQILAYLCGLHGLMDDVQEYLSRPCDTSYWAEADRHAAIALANPSAEEAEKRKNVLKALLQYASVASLSVGIVHYDIARIAFAQGKHDEARDNLKKAKQHAGRLIDTRLMFDPHLLELLDSDGRSNDSA